MAYPPAELPRRPARPRARAALAPTPYGSTGAGPGGNPAAAGNPVGPLAGSLGQIAPNVPAAPPNPYDFSSDPLYQRIMALGDQRTQQANAAALKAETQSIIDYGDPDLARSLGLGDAAIAAAAQNPFSTFAQLAKAEHDRPIALDESLNKQNLFYSGHRGLAQSDLAQSLGQDRYNAWQKEQGILGGIETTRQGALSGVASDEAAAANDAATRRQQQLGDLPQAQPFGIPRALTVTPNLGAALSPYRQSAPQRPRAPRPPRAPTRTGGFG